MVVHWTYYKLRQNVVDYGIPPMQHVKMWITVSAAAVAAAAVKDVASAIIPGLLGQNRQVTVPPVEVGVLGPTAPDISVKEALGKIWKNLLTFVSTVLHAMRARSYKTGASPL